MPRLHFVQELPVGSSKKDRELERARARAHAASVSYQSHHISRSTPAPKTYKSRKLEIKTSVYGHPLSEPISSDSIEGFKLTSPLTSSTPAQRALQTPPESPERRDPNATTLLDAVAYSARGQVLSPPESNWSESVPEGRNSDAEHIEDISVGTNSSTVAFTSDFSSAALIRPTTQRPNVYQINPHARYTKTSSMPRSTSPSHTTNLNHNFIPHDLLGTRVDPFDCIPRRHAHSASVDAVTDYHAQIMAPNHAPIYKIFNVTNVYTSYYFELLTHPDFLYTGVASVQAIIDHLKRKPDEPVGPSEQVMRHIGTAMGRLRKRLGRLQKEAREVERPMRVENKDQKVEGEGVDIDNNQSVDPSTISSTAHNPTLVVDDMTIMTVLFLAVVTRAINDLPSHEIHKRTIASLVSARGGLSNLTGHDGLARCTLMQWESFWALNTGVTIFPDARPPYKPLYPPLPIDVTSDIGRKVATLPEGFQSLAKQKILALDVIEVLARTAQAHIDQALHGTIVTPADVFRTKPRKYQDFWEACTCLGAPDEVCTDPNGTETTTTPNLQKMIVLALLLYCLHTFSPMRAVTAVYNGSRLKLMTDLPQVVRRQPTRSFTTTSRQMKNNIDLEESILLWIHFNLVDSWRAANDSLLPQGVSLMLSLLKRFPELTATWETCEDELKCFFWTDKFIGRCARFWSVGEVQREKEPTKRRDDG